MSPLTNRSEQTRFLQQVSMEGISDYRRVQKTVGELVEMIQTDPQQAAPTHLCSKPVIISRTLAHEWLDYTGDYAAAAAMIAPYRAPDLLTRIEQQDVKLCARITLAFGIVAYRKRQFAEAQREVAKSLDAYQQRNDLFGIGLAYYLLAKISHRSGDFDTAKTQAVQAIETFIQKLPGRDGLYRVAICNLLVSWLAFRQGQLEEARHCVALARMGVTGTEDFVCLGSIASVEGTLVRASAQTTNDYRDAVKFFEVARDFYVKAGHQTYIARAENNLGHAYTRLGDGKTAERSFKQALEAQPQDHNRTKVETLYFSARHKLQQGEYEAALDMVRQAIREAKKASVSSLEAEARVTLGRILLAMAVTDENLTAVHKQIQQAHDLNRDSKGEIISPKTAVACYLLTAELYCKQTPPDKAIATIYHQRATTILEQMPNSFLQEWADRAGCQISHVDGAFVLPLSLIDLTWERHQERLCFWLVTRALARVGKVRGKRDAVAQQLGMSRQALAKRVKSWRDNSQGKRSDFGKRDLLDIDEDALTTVLSELGYYEENGDGLGGVNGC